MGAVRIEKPDWAFFLSWMTHGMIGKRAEIDVMSMGIGAQIEAHWLPLLGLAYDRRSDVIEILLDGLDHLISRPRELSAAEDGNGLLSVLIIDEDGVQHLLQLKEPLALPYIYDQPSP